MKLRWTLLASLLGLVSACSSQASPAPTPLPPDYLPTVVALTAQSAFATDAVATLAAASPTATLEIPTATPTVEIPSPTPTLAAGFTEYAQLRFLSPGPMSSLTSPFILQAIIAAGDSDRIQVDLLGEDGRVLQRYLQKLDRHPLGVFQRFEFTFEIRAVSEAGYIRISTRDDYGRLQGLNTMPVLLYSVGTPQIAPPGNFIYERIAMDGFKEQQNFYGGEVALKGRIWPYNDQPFVVELISKEGRPLGSRILGINGVDTQPFETVIPYKVSEPTFARLTFRQENPLLILSDPDFGKLAYVYTIEVMLNP